MNDVATPSVGEDTRLSVIMHEYDTLRSEILLKYGTSVQMVTQTFVVLAGLLAALVVLQQAGTISIGALLVSAISLAFIAVTLIAVSIMWLDYDTRRASSRLRQIEEGVNRRAGEPLLVWETVYGWGGTFRKVR